MSAKLAMLSEIPPVAPVYRRLNGHPGLQTASGRKVRRGMYRGAIRPPLLNV